MESTSEPRRTRHPVCATNLWSYRVRTRAAAGSTIVRRKARGGLCADERSGWSDRHECACASGNHAFWPAGDCWAGTCAYSRSTPVWIWMARGLTTRLQPRHGRPSTVRGRAYRVKRQTCRNEPVTLPGWRLEITLCEQEKRVVLESEQPVDGTGRPLLASAPHQRRHPPFMTCLELARPVLCRAQPVDKAVGQGGMVDAGTFHAAGGKFRWPTGLPRLNGPPCRMPRSCR